MTGKTPVTVDETEFTLLVVGDLHLHRWAHQPLLKYQKALLSEILPNAIQLNGVGGVVFLGDLFHDKNHADKSLLQMFVNFLSWVPVPVYVLAGNHDWHLGSPSLEWLSNLQGVYAITEPTSNTISGVSTLFFPWVPDAQDRFYKEVVKHKPRLIFSHMDVYGVRYPSGYVPESAPDVSKVSHSVLILNGHYHTPSTTTFGKAVLVNVGSVFPTTTLEAGQKKSFVLLRFPSLEYELIPTQCPDLIVVSSRSEYEKKRTQQDAVVVFRPPVFSSDPSQARYPTPASMVERVKRAVVSLAQQNNLDPSYGLHLVDEVVKEVGNV